MLNETQKGILEGTLSTYIEDIIDDATNTHVALNDRYPNN